MKTKTVKWSDVTPGDRVVVSVTNIICGEFEFREMAPNIYGTIYPLSYDSTVEVVVEEGE